MYEDAKNIKVAKVTMLHSFPRISLKFPPESFSEVLSEVFAAISSGISPGISPRFSAGEVVLQEFRRDILEEFFRGFL